MASNNPQVNSSDPSVAQQVQRENATLQSQRQAALSSAPSVNGSGNATTTTASRATRSVAPVVGSSEVLYPQSTTTTSSNAVTINSSVNNDVGDVTTVYSTNGQITVNPINQTINQYTTVDSGVSQILAGNGVTITSTGTSGTGIVTINATGGSGNVGNIAVLNLDGNASNVLHGDGTWSADQTTYGNSNVAAYLPTYTGNVGAGNVNLSGNIIGSSTINIDNRATGNAADINLYSADDILLQARDRSAGSQSEGGDINIFAGDSAEDGDSSGGDVTITAGDGGAANIDYGGSGGFITIQSGQGGAASTGANGESALGGGTLTLRAGNAGTNNGNIDRGSSGGSVFIEAGDSTGNGLVGGSIFLVTGTAGANAEAGDLQIQVPSSDSGPGGTWRFDGQGVLELPGGGTIRNDGSLDIGNGDAISLEAGSVVNIYADTNGNAYQWQFGDDGNLTLPGNSSSINYANGTPYGGGGSGYIIPYEVATFVANTQPGFGEIQFADNEGANSAPATAEKLFIDTSPTNEQSLGTIFQQWTSNSYRGTLSLNNGDDSQATFNISNGRIYFEPETYRGFNAGLNQIWGDDCSINQLIITNATAPNFYNTDFLVEDDVFHASGLATGNTHVMLNIYGSSQYNPINPNDLWNTFVAFVDNVLYDNTTLRTNPDDIKTQFYTNAGSFRNNIPTQDLFQYFRFTQSSGADYFGTAPTTTNGSGIDATVRVRVNPNNTYTVLGTADPGSGYIGGETLTVLGTDLGGTTPTNDLIIFIDSVDGDGVITAVSYSSGTGVYPWPTNNIGDGGDDQYDTGNYINTNLATEISYANGITQTDSAAFGGGDYCVMYYQSFFCMVATGTSSSMSELFYSGNLGFDGDGLLNWTGLRSNQDVVANNNALYAYFDSEYLDGELTPTVGTTYNMTLDSAGINLDGFYAYNDTNTGDTFFGSNTDWRVESQSQLYVQSYNEMIIQTLVNQRGIGETGPALTVQAGDGSPGQREINAVAGNGGTVYVRGGDAGSSDEIDSLGNTGGRVEISGGVGSGNSQAGNVEINGGEGNNSGSINLRTDYGSNSTGKITLSTGSSGTTNTWEFRPDGSTIYPTLTVTRGDRTGTLSGQTLLFGDSTQGVIISTPNGTNDINDSQRIVINPGAGYANTTGEGGDIYLYAGRGGDAGGTGGDIKVRGGLGPVNGDGGYIEISGGEADGNGQGGYVEILGGESQNSNGGEVRLIGGLGGGTTGGNANITGGYGATRGGNINIIGGQAGTGLGDYGNIYIGSGTATWAFDNTGNTYVPNNGYVRTYNGTGGAAGGNLSITAGAADQAIYNSNAGGNLNLVGGLGGSNDGGGGGQGGNVNITSGASADPAGHNGNVKINTGGANSWTFDYTGNLTLPGNTFAVNYANGTQVSLGGGGGNTGNVTFDDITIQGVNQLNLSYDPLATANLAYLQVRGGDVTSHIHLDTGNNSAYDLFVGNDDKYVQVSSTGNIIMSSYDGNTSYIMTLDNTGDLILAGGSSIIRSVANSSLDPVNPNVSTMTFIPDAGYTSQSLVLDPTAPGHIHLRAPSANIDEPLANIFLGGEDSSFEVGYYNGNAPNLFIHSGGNTWEFLNDGNLVFPRDAAGNTDPFLRITGGASPRILSEDVSLAGPANLEITALNTIFTGSSGSAIKIYADDGEIGSTANLQIWTNSGGNTEYSWTFGDDGNLTTSSNLVISPSGLGTGTALTQSDAPLLLASLEANGKASLGWYENPTGPGNVVQVGLNDTTPGSMTVVTGDYSDTTYVWDFDAAGNLTLPTGGELNATGKIGYTSGGTATQSGTGQGVTVNELTGQITLAKSSWSAGDTEIFNISCNKIANADYVMAQVINGSEASYFNTVAYPFTAVANSIRVQVTAVLASTATPVVQFLIMKAATS